MLATMKRRARELEEDAKLLSAGDNVDASSVVGGGDTSVNDDDDVVDDDDDGTKNENDESIHATTRPMYSAMMEALQQLQPTSIRLVDNSHQHVGHAGSKGFHGESHFELEICSEAFQGLNLVKRHQLIYMMLGEVMPKIHALGIKANTPDEVAPQTKE
jgi:stress-induced morphogen